MDRPPEPLSLILLTRTGCGLCDEASGMLDRLAADYPLSVVSLDFDTTSGQALAQQTGVLFVPAVVINGQAVAEGRISERELRREFERRLGRGQVATGTDRRTAARPRGAMWRSRLGRLIRGW